MSVIIGCGGDITGDFERQDSEGNSIIYSTKVTILEVSYAGKTGTVIANTGQGPVQILLDNDGCSCSSCNCTSRPIKIWPGYLKVIEE